MRFFVTSILIFVLAMFAEMFFPWWSITIVAFVLGFLTDLRPWHAFLAGFTAISLFWLTAVLLLDIPNQHILSQKMAQLFHLPAYGFFILVTVLVGGIGAGVHGDGCVGPPGVALGGGGPVLGLGGPDDEDGGDGDCGEHHYRIVKVYYKSFQLPIRRHHRWRSGSLSASSPAGVLRHQRLPAADAAVLQCQERAGLQAGAKEEPPACGA